MVVPGRGAGGLDPTDCAETRKLVSLRQVDQQ